MTITATACFCSSRWVKCVAAPFLHAFTTILASLFRISYLQGDVMGQQTPNMDKSLHRRRNLAIARVGEIPFSRENV